MLCDSVDQNQINILSRGSNLNLYVGKICGMFFPLIKNVCFYFSFSPISKPSRLCPFIGIKKFTVGFQAYHVILFQLIQREKNFIVIITAVHNKGGLSKKSCALPNGIKCDRIYRFIAFLNRRMDSEKKLTRCLLTDKAQASVT